MLNLVYDPWLPVLYKDGCVALRSLDAVFREAADIRDLASTAAGEHAALTRFLVAIATYAWQTGEGDMATILGHLAEYAPRFELGGEAPFLQAPPRTTAALPEKTVALLRSGVPSGNNVSMGGVHFDNHPHPLTPSQAARALITANHYAVSSGKSAFGHTVDAPAARAAAFILHGQDLLTTIRANTLPAAEGDTPIWAQPDPTDWGKPRARHAPGLVRSVCWPWRAVTLVWSGNEVRWVKFAAGDTAIPAQDPMFGRLLSKKGDPFAPKLEGDPLGLLTRLFEAEQSDALPANIRAYLGSPVEGVTHFRIAGQVTNQSAVQDVLDVRYPISDLYPSPESAASRSAVMNALMTALYSLFPSLKPAQAHQDAARLLPPSRDWESADSALRIALDRLPRLPRLRPAAVAARAVFRAKRRVFEEGEPHA